MKKNALIIILMLFAIVLISCGSKNEWKEASDQTYYTEGLIISSGEVLGYDGTETKVIIPAVYEDEKVTTIKDGAFSSNNKIEQVYIPNSVTVIEPGAFFRCSNLKDIHFSNNLTFVGQDALTSTAWLTNQTDKIVYAGNVLYSYTELTDEALEVKVKEGTVAISDYAFSGATNVTSLNIPDSVIKIGKRAFFNCENLESITINGKIESCGEYAFHNTAWYKKQDYGIIYLGSLLYCCKGNLSGINNIEIEEGTTAIADYAFNASFVLLNDNQTIAVYKKIVMPDSLKYIGDYAFYESDALGKVVANNIVSIGKYAFAKTSIEEITFPSDLIYLGKGAFYNCQSLYNVDFGNCGITEISEDCFRESSVVNLKASESIEAIADGAFSDCLLLESIDMVNVKYIGSNTFYGCTQLDSIKFSNNLESIDTYSFNGCSFIEELDLSNTNLKSIPEGAFWNCTSLKSVKFNKQIETIGRFAFYCTNLEALELPASIKTLSEYSFNKCLGLVNISIPSSVTEIKANAFANCTNLISITFKSNQPAKLGKEAFTNTVSLIVPCGSSEKYKKSWPNFADQVMEDN